MDEIRKKDIEPQYDLSPEESLLTGYWIDLGSGMVRDLTWERIDWLVRRRLEEVAKASSGPDALYRDPRDGRLWDKTHPASHLKDGGPPHLVLITPEEARKKYGAISA